jgi:branched-chain amino acid aminotransferase
VTPIRSVDRIVVGDGRCGAITQSIQKRFFEIIKGTAADEFNWLMPVSGVSEMEPVAV